MEKADLRLLDHFLATHIAKTSIDGQFDEAKSKVFQLVSRVGSMYYKGHLIEIQGLTPGRDVTVRAVRSIPAEVDEDV